MQPVKSFFLFTFTLATAEAVELLRGPYLQMGTHTSVIVRWRTDEPTDSVVRYGTTAQVLNRADDEGFTTEHEIQITGLSPNQKYYYTIGSSEETLSVAPDQYFITHPIPGSRKPTRLWVIGDSGTASAGVFGSHLVRDGYLNYKGTDHTDVWLMLGDNAYGEGWDFEYQTAVFETYPTILRNTILWSTIGNHETYMNPGSDEIAYFDIFNLPTAAEAGGLASGTERYYSFDYANIHFVCLDSELSARARGGPMWNWLQQDLEANTNEWMIAFWHSPPYSKGSHNSDNLNDNFGNMTDMRTNFVSLLEQYGVDLVLSGHSHIYERSYLMHGHYGFSSSLQPTMVLDRGSGRPGDTGPYIKTDSSGNGAVYIVAGSSGWATFRTGFHPIMFYDALRLGSLVIDVNGNRMDVKFLRETAVVEDHFTILKGVPAEPLRVVAFRLDDGEAILRFKSVAGRSYQVESSPTLENADWAPAGPAVTATGATTSWIGAAPVESTGFYRVMELAP